MKITEQQLRNIIKESIEDSQAEEVAKIMSLWELDDPDGGMEMWEMIKELAYSSGVIKHPDLRIWSILEPTTGNITWDELNYDQATSFDYLAFTVYMDSEGSAIDNTPSAEDIEYAKQSFLQENPGMTNGPRFELDEEDFAVKVTPVIDELRKRGM